MEVGVFQFRTSSLGLALGFRVWGLGVGAQAVEFEIQSLEFRAWGLGVRNQLEDQVEHEIETGIHGSSTGICSSGFGPQTWGYGVKD